MIAHGMSILHQVWDTERMVDMPTAAPAHVREEILMRNVGELQAQLQAAYKRIAELTIELEREKSKTS
jgi:hypothetical protein